MTDREALIERLRTNARALQYDGNEAEELAHAALEAADILASERAKQAEPLSAAEQAALRELGWKVITCPWCAESWAEGSKAAPPAVQVKQRKWDGDPACTCGQLTTCMKHDPYCAPPADDEAVSLLREWVDPSIDGIGPAELIKQTYDYIKKAKR